MSSKDRSALTALRQFWDARQSRERWVLIIAGIALLALLYDSLIYTPITQKRQQALMQLDANRELVAWMQDAAATLAARREAVPARGTGASPMLAAERRASEAGVRQALERREPVGRNGLRVAFTAVSFNDLARWIELMQTQEGLQVTRASLVPVDGRPSRVNAELTLERDA